MDKIFNMVSVMAALCVCAPMAHADQTVWLSSLDLTHATQGWGQPQADKSVGGHTLTLDGQTYAHGFGTHAPGLLIVKLDGGTREFDATVGVDDEVGTGKGHVRFQVLGPQDQVLWQSGILHAGDPPQTAGVSVAGLPQIILRVTTAGQALDDDHADWADARFVVTGAMPQTLPIPPAPDPVIWEGAPSAVPHIRPPFVVGVHPRTPFLWTVPVTGERPLTFSVRGLPRGVTCDAATGTLRGVFARAGNYPVHVMVKNAAGQDSQTVHLVAGDSLALTPPIGWNSYDCFGDDVRESEVLANAQYLHDKMQPYGWNTVVVDYRWYDPNAHNNNGNAPAGIPLTMDKYGRLLPAPNRFPSAADGHGFKALADKVHAMGLLFGIHIMRGIPRNAVTANLPIQGSPYHAADAADTSNVCPWNNDMYGVRGNTPAGQAYYDSLFRLYASWGVDFVKMDDTSRPYHTDEIDAVHNAIAHCGRSIVLSLSPGATPLADAAHVAAHANMWREANDFWDNWGALNNEFTLGQNWHAWAAPGHWPDADMLPVGHVSVDGRSVGPNRQTNFTKNEQVTLLSLWALLPSPLMVGANLPDNDPWTLALLTNPDVLAIDQDAGGAAAALVTPPGDTEVWSKPLADGSLAVGLFNRGDLTAPVTARWIDLHLTGPYQVRDLWQRKNLGVFQDQYSVSIPAHGAVLLRLQKG